MLQRRADHPDKSEREAEKRRVRQRVKYRLDMLLGDTTVINSVRVSDHAKRQLTEYIASAAHLLRATGHEIEQADSDPVVLAVAISLMLDGL
jgi:hypothetical protein